MNQFSHPHLDPDVFGKTYRTLLPQITAWSGLSAGEFVTILGRYGWDAAKLLLMDPHVDADKWKPVRILGEGGFGAVSLWHSKDDDGNVEDEIVIKETAQNARLELPSMPGLAREAVLQYELNRKGCASVPRLRRYRFLDHAQPERRKYRFYFEFCPYGDLHRLIIRYRAWQRPLPELFLWEVFQALAEVACAMDRIDQSDDDDDEEDDGGREKFHFFDFDRDQRYPDEYYMLHLDLKPRNVLLGKRKRDAELEGSSALTVDYPSAFVSDFGLAHITGERDDRNPRNFMRTGEHAPLGRR